MPPMRSANASADGRLAARGRPCDKHRIRCHGPRCPNNSLMCSTLSQKMRPRSRRNCVGLARRCGCRPAARSTSEFPGDAARGARRGARRLAHAPISTLSRRRSRRKKLLVADMDSTIIGCECLDELADMAGLKVEGLRNHRARDARRNRIRSAPCASAWLCSRVCRWPRSNARTCERVKLNPGARGAGRDDEGARRAFLPRLGRVHVFHFARGRARRIRRPAGELICSMTAQC